MTEMEILCSDLHDIYDILQDNGYGAWSRTIKKAVELLNKQQPKTGHWIHYTIDPETEFPTSYWVCDACTKRIYGVGNTINYSFCPACGAKMEKPTNT